MHNLFSKRSFYLLRCPTLLRAERFNLRLIMVGTANISYFIDNSRNHAAFMQELRFIKLRWHKGKGICGWTSRCSHMLPSSARQDASWSSTLSPKSLHGKWCQWCLVRANWKDQYVWKQFIVSQSLSLSLSLSLSPSPALPPSPRLIWNCPLATNTTQDTHPFQWA